MTETVGVLRPTSDDAAWGDDTLTYPSPDSPTHTLDVIAVEPLSSSENNTNRAAVITGLAIYLPTGSDLRPSDHVVVRGVEYEADGELADWRNPFAPGVVDGLVQTLKRVAG